MGKLLLGEASLRSQCKVHLPLNLQLARGNRNSQTLCVRSPCFGCLGQYQFKDCRDIKIKLLANAMLAPIGMDKKMSL